MRLLRELENIFDALEQAYFEIWTIEVGIYLGVKNKSSVRFNFFYIS